MTSDFGRALGALVISCIGGAALVAAAPTLHERGWITPAETAPPQDVYYAIIDLTEDYDIISACPLDLDAARIRVEDALKARNFNPVFSPIAEGPDVLVHEVQARPAQTAGRDCVWDTTTLYAGHRLAMTDHRDITALEAASLRAIELGHVSLQ